MAGAQNEQFSLGGWSSRTIVLDVAPGAKWPSQTALAKAVDVTNKTYATAGLHVSVVGGAGDPAVGFTGTIGTACGGASDVMQPLALANGDTFGACGGGACGAYGRDSWDIHLAHELGHSLGLVHPFAGISVSLLCAGGDGDGDRVDDTPDLSSDSLPDLSCPSNGDYVCGLWPYRHMPTTYAMGYQYGIRSDGGRDISPSERLAVRATLYARGFE